MQSDFRQNQIDLEGFHKPLKFGYCVRQAQGALRASPFAQGRESAGVPSTHETGFALRAPCVI